MLVIYCHQLYAFSCLTILYVDRTPLNKYWKMLGLSPFSIDIFLLITVHFDIWFSFCSSVVGICIVFYQLLSVKLYWTNKYKWCCIWSTYILIIRIFHICHLHLNKHVSTIQADYSAVAIFSVGTGNIYIIMWSCPGNMPKYYPGLRDIFPDRRG